VRGGRCRNSAACAGKIGLNGVVITMRAVVEVPTLTESPPWPVAPLASGSWLELDGGCTDEQVGLFVAALADRIEVASPGRRDAVVDALLAEELLILAGGLQVGDTSTGTVVVPGCCAGLEDWRDWDQVLTGGAPWLGHDPGPEVEVVGGDLRVWQDGGPNRHRGHWAGRHVDLPSRALPRLLRAAQRDLIGFLDALTGWAARTELGHRGIALMKAVDQNFAVTKPWSLPAASDVPR
jgi:hypothetical protein